jgi:nicotinamidase-related amidase
MPRPWEGIVSAEEIRAYEAAGFGRSAGIGKRPALLIIDVQYRTVGTKRMPFWDAIKEFKTSCGEVGWKAVDHIVPLLQLFRRLDLPVMYPHVAPKLGYDGGRLAEKVPDIMNIAAKGYEFVAEIAPRERDILIPKKHPSAFFATAMTSYLIDQGCDSVVITGCTTSGCVRASAVDAFAYNFKVVVPEECVYDRSAAAHAVNLFDMAYKYAEVRPASDVMAMIEKLPRREAA